ncbi:MAG: flagellar biosynthetic protein FliR [Candidatus Marinimicrobia bacterium]|nr:flagellar biosynthetic protein FliR [Candidatus Neomarinimicrobiota bacterium]
MYELIDKMSELMPGFMLVFFRIVSMLMVLPIFGYQSVPQRLRFFIGFVLAIVVFPTVNQSVDINSVESLIINISREVFIGLIVGFGARLIFEAFYMAGGFIGRQMALGLANVMDPTSHQQLPIISNFWLIVVMAFVFAVNAHYYFVALLAENFKAVPLGLGSLSPRLGRHMIEGGSILYRIGVGFAAPAMVFLLLVDIAISFMARVMPRMNVFFVTLPLKIFTGIVVLIISLSIFQVIFDSFFSQMVDYVNTILIFLRG